MIGEAAANLMGSAQRPLQLNMDDSELVQRDRLVSAMLQDRGTLRLISAPHGYGKTVLAYQYAARTFEWDHVVWIDGASPEFLQSLDDISFKSFGIGKKFSGLLVIDDLPVLDERRMPVLTTLIDDLLVRGVEVVVTTLPSCDYLRTAQPDRILIAASELEVTERDVRMLCACKTELERKGVIDAWEAAGTSLFGHAPCSVWGSSDERVLDSLSGFFEEKLPLEMFKASVAMMLLGRGTFSDLEKMGVEPSLEVLQMLSRDYAFFNIEPLKRRFSAGEIDVRLLRKALSLAGMEEPLICEAQALHSGILNLLAEAGQTEKACKVMEEFQSPESVQDWLKRCGWALVDRGEDELVRAALRRCSSDSSALDAGLLAIQAWSAGLVGDLREAEHCALRAMELSASENSSAVSQVMAYLAVLMYSSDKDRVPKKERFESGSSQGASKLLVEAVNACDATELLCALEVVECGFSPTIVSSKRSAAEVTEERETYLELLLLENVKRYGRALPFRILFHIVASINSVRLKDAIRNVGYEMVAPLYNDGARSYSEALVVWDLWRSGFFGVGEAEVSIRDSRLISTAMSLISKLATKSGGNPSDSSWNLDIGHAVPLPESLGPIRKRQGGREDRIPIATVTMFGGMEVYVGGRYIPESKWNRRSIQLFEILVLNQGKDVSREAIFKQMWPELSRSRALDNFYSAWSRMQALLGEGPYFSRRGEFCSINSRYVTSDVAEFEQLSRRLLLERNDTAVTLDIYARIESLYRGGLLPSETKSLYIAEQRERFRSVYVDGMVTAVQRSLEAKDPSVALWFARRAMEEDSGREDVYAAMIKAQVAAGQRCSAIRTYFKCREFLREELGLDPSVDTQALYAQLIAAEPSLKRLRPNDFCI